MYKTRERTYDILSVGELLIDFISQDFADSFDEASDFKLLQGGSPANLCMNMARLGNKTKLVATVGKDEMGSQLLNMLHSLEVNTDHLFRNDLPTTLILVTRSKGVSNFEPYRSADCRILETQLPDWVMEQSTIFHTTCFALSKNPAQDNIIRAYRKAAALGCQLSMDVNYARKIWPEQKMGQRIVEEYCSLNAIIKISEVDWERLYNKPIVKAEQSARHFLDMGAKEVCITLGDKGCYAASMEDDIFLPARRVQVKDTTGAGDAFWSGYLTAWLDGQDLEGCCKAGRKMAELKLSHFGPFPGKLIREKIYSD